MNHMTANPDKYQVIVLSKTDSSVSHKLNICDNDIETTKPVKLISVEIDHQLRFNQHISTLCFKALMQLIKNTLSSLQRFVGKVEKTAMINSFIYANFNSYPLTG